MTHLDRFIDSLTEEDFINAYPGSLELLLDDSGKGLEVCKYIQKNVPSISLYIGNVSKFQDKLQEYMKGKEHEFKKVALDMRISEQSLLRAIKKNKK
jgi:hypothetical protein